MGADYKYAIVEGTDSEELRKGPGRYPGTAMPGQTGNFLISEHRTIYSAPFNRINELRHGDSIVVDARDARHTCQASGRRSLIPPGLMSSPRCLNIPHSGPRRR
ncbi:sortase domain-containing protein [Planotetraspora mira]|uniref:sortase domain-containing protein n=1 Tax=Planotetraspora mira TaxID=58121 RepID=UPI00194F6E57